MWTNDELDEMVASFDADHPPKHVIEHDELYSPFSFGQISDIKRDGDNLYVRSDEGCISPMLDELVDGGYVTERSIRIGTGDDGKFRLEHNAWLGAAPPAVEKLQPVRRDHAKSADAAIAAGKALGLEPITIDHSADVSGRYDYAWKEERKLGLLKRLWQGVRDLTVEKHGIEVADRHFPAFDGETIDDMKVDEAVDSRLPKPKPKAADALTPEPNHYSRPTEATAVDVDNKGGGAAPAAPSAADFAKAQDALTAQAAELAALKYQAAVRDARDVVKAAVADGRLPPACAEGVAEFMAALPDAETAEFSFSRRTGTGEAAKTETVKQSAQDFFKGWLATLPKVVKTDPSDFSADDGVGINADAEAIAGKALEYQRKQADVGKPVSLTQAVAHVRSQQEA